MIDLLVGAEIRGRTGGRLTLQKSYEQAYGRERQLPKTISAARALLRYVTPPALRYVTPPAQPAPLAETGAVSGAVVAVAKHPVLAAHPEFSSRTSERAAPGR